MTPNTCNNCGFVQKYPSSSHLCPVCGAIMPTADEAILLSNAIDILDASRFDEAKTAFENIIFQYPNNAQAYWGRLRARYHITYTTDRLGNSFPTCPTRSGANIFEDVDYVNAMTYANDQEKAFMQKQAEQIKTACTPSGPSKNREDRFIFGKLDQNDAFIAKEEEENRAEAKKRKIKKTVLVSSAFVLITVTILFWFGVIPAYSANGLQLRSNGNGSFRVSGIGNCRDTEIEIPSKYLGMPVTDVENHVFRRRFHLISVVIPEGITSIDGSAFHDCRNLTSISIPNSVKTIDSFAFSGCNSLSSIVIPEGVTHIGNSAFNDCKNLTSIQFSGTVEQWNAISFDHYWNSGTGNYTITCTDGTLAKNGTVIK